MFIYEDSQALSVFKPSLFTTNVKQSKITFKLLLIINLYYDYHKIGSDENVI